MSFIASKRAAFIMPSVSGVCGTVRITKSASGSSSSSASGGCSSASPSLSSLRRASMPTTVIPKPARTRAVSAPISPTPISSAVDAGR